MRGYSGSTDFDFEIERYVNKKTGQKTAYLLDPEDPEYEYETFTLKVEGSAYFTPGRLSGPPENCYPDEGDCEIIACVGPDGKDWESQLTHSERDAILDQIQEEVSSDEGPDPDDYDYEPDSGRDIYD